MLKENILKFLKLDGIIDNLTGYVETQVALMKLEVKEDIAKVLGKVLIYLVLAFVFIFFLLFISLAAALELGERLGSFAGFAIVSGFYLLVALLILTFRKGLDNALQEKIKETLRSQKE